MAQSYQVALLDVDMVTLTAAVEKIYTSHKEDAVLAVHCVVSNPAQVRSGISRVDALFGRIDALVNNAGIAVRKPVMQCLELTIGDASRGLPGARCAAQEAHLSDYDGDVIEPASVAECIQQARALLETTTNWLQANRADLLTRKK